MDESTDDVYSEVQRMSEKEYDDEQYRSLDAAACESSYGVYYLCDSSRSEAQSHDPGVGHYIREPARDIVNIGEASDDLSEALAVPASCQ